MELLSPAGNYQKFRTALRFGADAVYLSGQAFGLRAFAGNFSDEEIVNATAEAHKLGKKVYVTLNILAKDSDFIGLDEYIKKLIVANVDAVIVSDLGIIAHIRKNFPMLDVHVSTQANVTNLKTAEFLADLGVKRIVLARELNLEEIAVIAKALKDRVEIECFVHGAMCVSYSGRCLLSDYLSSRSANHGECVQACRWRYTIREISREDELPIEEDEHGTYILNSKDMCMIEHLKELEDAGIASLKIEGRMKSEYYVACVTAAYRRAIDMLPNSAGDEFVKELEKTSHRRFTTGFYFGEKDKQYRQSSSPIQTHEFVGVVQGVKNGIATIEQRNYLKNGDIVEVLSPNNQVHNHTFTISDMHSVDGEPLEKANVAQMLFTCACNLTLTAGDILRKKID